MTKKITNYIFLVFALFGFVTIPIALQMTNHQLARILLATPSIICGMIALIELCRRSLAPFPFFIFMVSTLVAIGTAVILFWAMYRMDSFQTAKQAFLLFYCTAMLVFGTSLLEDKQ